MKTTDFESNDLIINGLKMSKTRPKVIRKEQKKNERVERI